MDIERGKRVGPLHVSHDLHLLGVIQGSTTVRRGADLLVDGMIAGDLHVEEGATATVAGLVTGHVTNSGGLIVTGIVVGTVRSLHGSTVIEPGAIVDGIEQTSVVDGNRPLG